MVDKVIQELATQFACKKKREQYVIIFDAASTCKMQKIGDTIKILSVKNNQIVVEGGWWICLGLLCTHLSIVTDYLNQVGLVDAKKL